MFSVSIYLTGSPTPGASNKPPRPPKFEEVLGQQTGVFLYEYRWNKASAGAWRVVAINCDQRRVFCNTLGVVPFQMDKLKQKESAETHKQVARLFYRLSSVNVWRVLQRVGAQRGV